ncbi:MAG: 3-dehydroquinate synthase [Microgenomates group bacterium GW2011_GWA1_48_10]|nr:MAG: 3-dehydroquinate synthase [Microgenomates group bacterium GW2011_GWA1_48_10]
MDTFTINSRFKQYSVAFTEQFGFFKRLASLENAVYVVDENVLRLYPEHFAAIDKERLFPFHAVEEKKNMESVLGFVRVLLRQDVRRNTTLVSIGGGITQDVTGCVASILYRGIPWIFVPTTLLAQVDSCIGSKTSLNLDSYKNVLGAFYPPDEIYVDVGFVDTLSALDRWSGIGELVKLLLMDVSEAADLKRVKREIETLTQNKEGLFAGVKKGLAIKKSYIEEDEFDHGRRNLLNYGHTLGHALEGVSDFRIPHGIGVVIGMLHENLIALRRGRVTPETVGEVNRGILLPNLHLEEMDIRAQDFEAGPLLEKMSRDKKRTGAGLAMILPRAPFALERVQDVSPKECTQTLADLAMQLSLRG